MGLVVLRTTGVEQLPTTVCRTEFDRLRPAAAYAVACDWLMPGWVELSGRLPLLAGLPQLGVWEDGCACGIETVSDLWLMRSGSAEQYVCICSH